MGTDASLPDGKILYYYILHRGVRVYHRNVPHGASELAAWRVRDGRKDRFHDCTTDTATGE